MDNQPQAQMGLLAQSFVIEPAEGTALEGTLKDSKIMVLTFKSLPNFNDPSPKNIVVAQFPISYQLFNDLGIVIEGVRNFHGKLPPNPDGYINVPGIANE